MDGHDLVDFIPKLGEPGRVSIRGSGRFFPEDSVVGHNQQQFQQRTPEGSWGPPGRPARDSLMDADWLMAENRTLHEDNRYMRRQLFQYEDEIQQLRRQLRSTGGSKVNELQALLKMRDDHIARLEEQMAKLLVSHSSPNHKLTDTHTRTKLCRTYSLGTKCKYEDCLFAHSLKELTPIWMGYKQKICEKAAVGKCMWGSKCKNLHGEHRTMLEGGFSLVYGGSLKHPRLQYFTESEFLGMEFYRDLNKIIAEFEGNKPKSEHFVQIIVSRKGKPAKRRNSPAKSIPSTGPTTPRTPRK